MEEKEFKVHIAEIYMRNLKAIDLYNPDYKFGLNFSQTDSDYIDGLLAGSGISLGQEILGLCPCVRYGCKDWIPEEGAKFVKYISQNTSYKVVIIGQDSGKDFANNLKKLGITDFIDLTNKTTVPQLAALIKKFKIFVSVDTAPMHMGIALDIPTIGLFVQSNYGKWWPGDNERRRLVYEPTENSAETLIKKINEFTI
jgi:ADP-heptose:LPS heptosyltransferase